MCALAIIVCSLREQTGVCTHGLISVIWERAPMGRNSRATHPVDTTVATPGRNTIAAVSGCNVAKLPEFL